MSKPNTVSQTKFKELVANWLDDMNPHCPGGVNVELIELSVISVGSCYSLFDRLVTEGMIVTEEEWKRAGETGKPECKHPLLCMETGSDVYIKAERTKWKTRCVKCGHRAHSTRYVEGSMPGNPLILEYLQLKCDSCGYEWTTECYHSEK